MKRHGASRKGVEMTIAAIIAIVLGLLLLWFFGVPLITKMMQGANAATTCDGQCLPSCPDGYLHQDAHDSYCIGQFQGTKTGAVQCCEPLQLGEGQVARIGDFQFYIGGDKSQPVMDGGTVAMKSTSTGVAASLSFQAGSSLQDRRCYGQVSWGNAGITNVQLLTSDKLKSFLKSPNDINLKNISDITLINTANTIPCNDLTGSASLSLGSTDYQLYLGQQIKYSLVAVDPKCGADDWRNCDSATFSFYVSVPDRHPAISLKVDNQLATPNVLMQLSAGAPHTVDVIITDPLQTCNVLADTPLNYPPIPQISYSSTAMSSLLSAINAGASAQNCFDYTPYRRSTSFTIDQTLPGGIPFSILVNTSMANRAVVVKYLFQIAPDVRVRVIGPSSGLAKEKNIDVTCANLACNKVTATTIKSLYDCSSATTNLNFGLNATGTGNSFRFTLRNETDDGNYVCVRAETSAGTIYALGLWNSMPSSVAIDTTPPSLDVSFDSFQGIITFHCLDKPGQALIASSYVSGCKDKPISYAYVTDPLQFAAYVVTGGALASTFNGCPAPDDTTHWYLYNSNNQQMPYLSQNQIQVMCVRATDNAGNSVVQSKLLYSSQAVLSALLTEYMVKKNS